ncbi:MAG: NTP transferase domain-containing protein [Spirochaetales bacterium]|nr:NTP transferase domain-containing protein [Spirochaetales bacterium]
MRLGVILQARLDSSRLPRKALLPFGGVPMVEACMRRLSRVAASVRILACDEASARVFEPLAARAGFELVPGPKEDVLARFALAIRKFSLERVIRATADNPFVSPELASLASDLAVESDLDYAALEGMPLGLGVEAARAAALLAADAEAVDPYEREHVCPFLYRRPERFRVRREAAPQECRYPAGRVTVDTAGDYERALDLAHEAGFDPSTRVLVAALKALESGDWSLVQPWTAE